MYGGDQLDKLVSAAIDDAPRERSAQTAAALGALLEALTRRVESRSKFRGEYASAAKFAGTRDERAAVRSYDADYDGADDTDILTGAWLRRISGLPSALEPTVAAVVDAVLFCDKPTDMKSALGHFDAAAAKDKKIHADRGRQLVKEYPQYGNAAAEDRNEVDFVELGKAREKHPRGAK
jgi:hypothetical protein